MKVHTKMSDQRLFSAPTTRNEITLIQRSVLDVAVQPACTRACACHSAAAAWARRRNLVSHTMGDDIPPSARSRGVAKSEKPTQDTSARAECPVSATKSASSGAHSAQNAQVS